MSREYGTDVSEISAPIIAISVMILLGAVIVPLWATWELLYLVWRHTLGTPFPRRQVPAQLTWKEHSGGRWGAGGSNGNSYWIGWKDGYLMLYVDGTNWKGRTRSLRAGFTGDVDNVKYAAQRWEDQTRLKGIWTGPALQVGGKR